jgi:MYXO-CTERM domain-containing protein
MNRLCLMGVAVLAGVTWANPTKNRWFFEQCETQSCASGTVCTNKRCVPVFKTAATVGNLSNGNDVNGIPYQDIVNATQRAFANWTGARVTDCQTSWDIVYGGSFSSPVGQQALGNNGSNNVIWLTGNEYAHGSTTLALTTTWAFESGKIVDADMELNGNVKWDDEFGNVTTQTRFDYESIILHEVGHFLGLAHSTPRAAVMFADFLPAETRRSLTPTDTNDVCTVYPPQNGGQGASCTNQANCTGGTVCEAPVGTNQRICTKDCTAAGQACPNGFSCQPSTAGFACLPGSTTSDLCTFCANGSACSTGLCVFEPSNGMRWCSSNCTTDAQCGAGFTCKTASFGNYCSPNAMCASQCTGAAQCPVGFDCKMGTCLPTGKIGDRCEISGACNKCGTCVQDINDPSVAFCRGCCSGTLGDGQCASCTVSTCDNGSTCQALSQNKDKACIPTNSSGVCQPCSASAPCGTGLECVSGKCHALCNPATPGACSACFERQVGQNAICACPEEVGRDGDPCGLRPDQTFTACANGLSCVGAGQKYCRKTCRKDALSDCARGETCSTVNGKDVCINLGDGSACTPCGPGGTCQPGLTCNAGRCYTQCNVNVQSGCATCVQLEADGRGVCACDDERAGVNQPCGLDPIRGCQSGTKCFGMAPNEPTCRAACDMATQKPCGKFEACKPYLGGTYCLDKEQTMPEPEVDAGTVRPDSGKPATMTTNQGCGCSAEPTWPLLFGIGLLLRRRRHSTQ